MSSCTVQQCRPMADVRVNSMACHPRDTCHIAGCCHLVHLMLCHFSATHQVAGCCRLANSMSCNPRATHHVAGCFRLANSMSWSQSYSLRCRVLPPGEFNVMIPQSRSTLHGGRISSAILTRSSAVAERPRALRVTEYFAKSLKVIRNDTVA